MDGTDTTRAHPGIPQELHDDLREMKINSFKRFISPWVSVAAGASYQFKHGLGHMPYVTDVLQATSSQGAGQASAASVTTTKTDTIVTVTNGAATAKFFQLRTF